MLRHVNYTQDRIRQLAERIQKKIYADRAWVDDLQVAGPVDRISYEQAQQLGEWRTAKAGDQFGPIWSTFWFRGNAVVPNEWKGHRVDLLWDSQSEAMLWIDGRTIQGLNMTQGDRPDAILADRAKGGETLAFQIEMACNTKFGVSGGDGKLAGAGVISPYHLRRCEIARFNPKAWDLYFDYVTLVDLQRELAKESASSSDQSFAGLLLSELNRFCNEIDIDDETTWPAAQKILKDLYQHRNPEHVFELSAVGHAHIDTAWLWPLAETWRKCERTFSSQTRYMRDYPEFRFSCSQAYQYDIIKQRNPDLYERIRKHVKTGQWVIVGGSWIEPDCNIPSGEALCRQFLLGQRFFEREFGVRCKEFWNPDVFGYNGQLPQIMNLCGIMRFLTQKLSWNHFNKPQYHTFTWQGIDGSEVLAHFPPADNYNAFMTWAGFTHVTWIRKNAELYKDHDRAHNGFMLYGWGDGGGGPTKEQMESLRRCADLRGVPRTKQRTSDEFFTLLEKDITDRPLQVGELYFEYHRGTYTTQALVKKNNRRGEFLLHDIEFVSVATLAPSPQGERAGVRGNLSSDQSQSSTGKLPPHPNPLPQGRGDQYPQAEINKLWEVLLLNQFHDILPGSSIREVYEDSKKQFAELTEQGEAIVQRAIGRGASPLNTIGFARTEVIEHDGKLHLVEAPSYGTGRTIAASDKVTLDQKGDRITLQNAALAAVFTTGGKLISLVHRATGRESLAGEANVFETYDDKPTQFDAWDIDPFAIETRKLAQPAHSFKVVRNDPLRVEILFEQKLAKHSLLKQTIRLDTHAKRLEFHCAIDWNENETLLKVAYPINARAMNATYEMQFGNVERPTHYNTLYDLAKFEVPYHKWFDLSEHGFGVSILTDSKYGGSTFGNTMRISLLRSPMSPDKTADRHHHTFAYALYPHAGGWREAGTVAESFRFNVPLRFAATSIESFAQIDDANVVIDTIKKAEDSDATIVRLYECHGARGIARLQVNRAFKKATFCNVLEEDQGEATVENGQVLIDYAPYKIISVKLA